MTVERSKKEEAHTTNDEGRLPVQKRYLLVGLVVAVAFFGSYAYASSARTSSGPALAAAGVAGGAGGAPQAGGAGGAGGGGCCGGSGGGAPGGGSTAGGAPGGAPGTAPGGSAGGSAGGGGGCCGGGGSGKTTKGTAKVNGGAQTIAVDASNGYSPNQITLKAGVPTEIKFSPASGCLGTVIFPDAQIQTDLSQGATVKLPAMQPGTYQFYCGMQMVFGKLIVK